MSFIERFFPIVSFIRVSKIIRGSVLLYTQIRDVGRRYRTISEDQKEIKTELEEARKRERPLSEVLI